MRAALTGATGLLGANLVRALLDAGHQVQATHRARSDRSTLEGLPLQWHEASLGDLEALTRAFQGADWVFHCAAAVSIKRQAEPWMVEANVGGTERVIAACRAAGVRRLIHCSSTVAVGLAQDGRPADETSPWNLPEAGLDDGYASTKRQAEQRVLEAAAAGLDAVVVNPGYLLGPYDARPSSGKLILDVVRRAVPGYSAGCNSFVDVRDVAAGMVLVAERGRAGQRYILGGENLGYGEIFRRIAAVAGTQPPSLAIPRWVATIPALWGDLQESLLGKQPLLNRNTIAWGYEPRFVVSSLKAEAELGYTRRPVEEGIAEALRWFRQRGLCAPLPNFP